jgi:DNA-nicking Smr family endonuclease
MRKKADKSAVPVADAHLWRAVTDSARPLKGKRRAKTQPSHAADFRTPAPPAAAKPVKKLPAPRPAPPAVRPGPSALRHGTAPDVDRNTAARFKKGEMPIEATLDLHGMTQESAHAALAAFISRARAAGRRCVLVVTGKGGRAAPGGESKGVLRANVPRWLNEPDLRPHILAFAHARPRHGGEGALYVLLKRVRRENAP